MIEFKPEAPFSDFKIGLRCNSDEPSSIIALYKTVKKNPFILTNLRYKICVKNGKIISDAEYNALVRDICFSSPMKKVIGRNSDIFPYEEHSHQAGHHWFQRFNKNGELIDKIILQWDPNSSKWVASGDIGKPKFVDTKNLKYLCPVKE